MKSERSSVLEETDEVLFNQCMLIDLKKKKQVKGPRCKLCSFMTRRHSATNIPAELVAASSVAAEE